MQRRSVLIVDGYNVLRNNKRYDGLGVDYEGGSQWNKAREAVINDAALMAAGQYERCTVVFDGGGNPNSTGKTQRRAGINVVFSPAGVTADTIIEHLAIDAREHGFEVVVVSSDFAIQTTVFGGGVTRMSASSFAVVSETLEDEWHEGGREHEEKNKLSERIDPKVAQRLHDFARGAGEL